MFFLEQTNLESLMKVGCFPPPSLKVPQLLSNLFVNVVSNNGVYFSFFIKVVMTFFKSNQFVVDNNRF